ncbi:butyrate kinase [Virgibacillus sp. W0181]|uniref:butyrate kinase n=1 Tax=Virgibacillus sp. W0181 TaxID=3391581 RepID=UPI003F44AB8C
MLPHKYRTLVINPKTEITKIAVFDNEICVFERSIQHGNNELKNSYQLMDQVNFRKKSILDQLDYEGLNLSKLDAICARGGLLKPIKGGTYEVNDEMIKDLQSGFNGVHPSNLGAVIAKQIADGLNITAYIVDPVVVDELDEKARYSGISDLPRKSIFHALNHKAVARRAANELNKRYEETNLIVVHMASGITIGAHQRGKVIDVNNGLDGEGPFTLERAGTVPAGDLIALCFSEQYNYKEVMDKLVRNSGLKAYLQTDNIHDIENDIENGNQQVKEVYEAMAYQIAKEIGSMSAVLSGKVDAVVLTGELAYGKFLIQMISERINWIADVLVYPGADELQALNEGTLRVLKDMEQPKTYPTNRKIKE